MKKLAVLVIATILAGCATKYGQMSFRNDGGYSDTQISKDTFLVNFVGNEMTNPGRVRDLAMLRASEIMLENGYSHFVVMDIETNGNTSSFTMPNASTTTVSYGGYTSTNYQLPMTIQSTNFASRLKVKGFTPHTAPHDALEAKKMVASIKAKYKIK